MSINQHPVNDKGILILSGKSVAANIKQDIASRIKQMEILDGDKFIRPWLAIVSIGDDKASESYIRGKVKDCLECGIECGVDKLDKDVSLEYVKNHLKSLSNDPVITGIILQLPLPDHLALYQDELLNCISPEKDVDCLTDVNIGRLSHMGASIRPCTPDGIMEILRYYDIDVSGKDVVIVNRSDIVGKPLATLMTMYNATVTVCHSKTKNLAEKLHSADIVVIGVGHADFINYENVVDMLQPQAVVIDVGINRNEEGKLVGDVNYEAVEKTCSASAITPVPGGVGLTTRACLMRNVWKAYERQMMNIKISDLNEA